MIESPVLAAILTLAGAVAISGLIAYLVARPASTAGAAAADASRPATWSSGLARTRGGLAQRLLAAWRDTGEVGAWLDRVEETLLSSDVGLPATRTLIERWRSEVGAANSEDEVRAIMRRGVADLLAAKPAAAPAPAPHVVLVVGVNGVGKTTTIGKLARHYSDQGHKVLLVAADTFRAAAIDQLARWAERVGVDLVRHQHGADPSAVAFDGVKAAVARGADVVLIDTAGRLHVKANLMEEVKKIQRTVGREVEGAPHQVLLVIDATTGQNALNQARVFHEALGVSGVALTKLDGTAKGGVALAIRSELDLPIHYVGLGEGAADLAPLDAAAFAAALFEDGGVAANEK